DNVDFTIELKYESGIAVGSREVPVRDETLLLLPLDKDASDISGNGFDGKTIKDASFTEHASWATAGGNKKVLDMGGTSSLLDCGFGYLGRKKGFTISAWIKAENSNYNWVVLSMGGAIRYGSMAVHTIGDHIEVSGKAIDNEAGLNGVAMPKLVSAAGSFTYETWHHIAVSWDGMKGNLYIDGNLAASEDWSKYAIFQMKPFRVGTGTMNETANAHFDGKVSDVQLLSRALSDEEIASDYYSGSYRISSDGGKTWSAWSKSSISGANGAKAATLSVTGAALPQKGDSLNRVQVVVRDVNGHAGMREYILLADGSVPVKDAIAQHKDISLYPNPFKDKLNISFEVKETKLVELNVYGIDGKLVRNLSSTVLKPGRHNVSWNGRSNSGAELLSGQYFVRVNFGKQVMVKRVLKLQ
ncbi:MAG: T9SS type A sorting domain-containing protein, partial [Fibrobacteria bacterium]|nr:T9SS type A sorting domain-containing protein [Fibrobacteria bacterium]